MDRTYYNVYYMKSIKQKKNQTENEKKDINQIFEREPNF